MAIQFFSKEEQQQIVAAIDVAEKKTSGEIRVFVEERLQGKTAMERAVVHFSKLKMDQTAARNGVLIYVATLDKSFAIIGDEGINQLVPADFWDQTKQLMLEHFKTGEIAVGIVRGIEQAARELEKFFPYKAGDKNELSNEIAHEKNLD